jgi:nitrogen fixation protein FixH
MKVRQISNYILQKDEPSSAIVLQDLRNDMPEEYIVDNSEVINSKNAITGWKIVTIGLLFINLFVGVTIIGMLFAAISRSMPTFITKGNGETETLEFFTGTDRSPTLVKFFAQKTMTGIYTWRNTLPEKGNIPDPGIAVEGGRKIPTTAYRYTLALEPEFANSYRKQLGQLQSIVQGSGNSAVQTAYIVEQVSEPESLGSGKWNVKVAGTQLIVNSNNEQPKKLNINVEMTVRAVPPPLLSEVTRKYEDIGIAKAAQIARAEGLEVISITNIK